MKNSYLIIPAILSMTLSYTFGQSGTPDTSFGGFGLVATDVTPNRIDFLTAIVIQDDQKILAAGTTQNLPDADFAVVRYLPDGSLDPEFGDGGISVIDFNNGDDRSYGMAIQPDGRILVCGHADVKASLDFAIVRLNTNGLPDSTFGENGKVTTDMASGYEQANTVALQSDGKIIIAGRVADGNYSNFGMVRYYPDGEIDEEFGTDGKVNTNIMEEDEARSAAIQPDGKIILAGFASVSAKGDFAMVRYNPDGTPDKEFGDGGIVLTDLEGAGRSDFATSMVLEKNGQIVLAGNANFNNLFIESDMGVVRYNSDGKVDKDFAVDGIFILTLGTNTQPGSIVQQLDGKYLIGGKTNLVFGQNMWLLARLTNEGKMDTSFASSGMTMIDLPGENEFISSMAIQRDSRIVAGGYNGNFNALDFTVGRFITDFTMFVLEVTPILCNGDSTSTIGIYVDGGVPPYMYSLDGVNFSPFSLLFNLPAGEYLITVIDQEGRTSVYGPFNISQPPPPGITVVLEGNTILITADRPADLLYSIDGGITYVADSIFTDLNDGLYEVLVIDGNGCNLYSDEILITFTGVDAFEAIDFAISPNPSNESINITVGKVTNNAEITIWDPAGRILVARKLGFNQPGLIKMDVSSLSNGMYFLGVNDGMKAEVQPFVISR